MNAKDPLKTTMLSNECTLIEAETCLATEYFYLAAHSDYSSFCLTEVMIVVLHLQSSKSDQKSNKAFYKKTFDKFLNSKNESESWAHLSFRLVLKAEILCGPGWHLIYARMLFRCYCESARICTHH